METIGFLLANRRDLFAQSWKVLGLRVRIFRFVFCSPSWRALSNLCGSMPVLVVGSIALDDIKTPP